LQSKNHAGFVALPLYIFVCIYGSRVRPNRCVAAFPFPRLATVIPSACYRCFRDLVSISNSQHARHSRKNSVSRAPSDIISTLPCRAVRSTRHCKGGCSAADPCQLHLRPDPHCPRLAARLPIFSAPSARPPAFLAQFLLARAVCRAQRCGAISFALSAPYCLPNYPILERTNSLQLPQRPPTALHARGPFCRALTYRVCRCALLVVGSIFGFNVTARCLWLGVAAQWGLCGRNDHGESSSMRPLAHGDCSKRLTHVWGQERMVQPMRPA